MSSIHIVTDNSRIENKNIGIKIHKILTPKMEQIYQEELLTIREHENKLQCGLIDIEVRYPEIHDQESTAGDGYKIIPEYMIPGRPFPIYIYLYAITTYSFNPAMGQREAAKRTRERFQLKTFSHTTLGRAMKRLEEKVKEYKDETQDTKRPTEDGEAESRTFPSVNQIKARKEKVAAYIKKSSSEDSSLTQEAEQLCKEPDYRRPPYTGAFVNACHSIAGYTFLNYRRFLL